ncbi:MAG: hypothetical protein ABIS37_00105 [Bacteroidia bacterium]
MIKIYFTSIFLLLYCSVSAQAVFQNIIFDEKQEPGLMLQLPNKPEVVQNTILQRLEEIGYNPETKGALFWKSNKINGFYVFKQVTLPALKNQTLDFYFNVEQQKENKKKSTLYMLVSKGYNNFVSPEADSAVYRAARRFLNGFIKETAAYKLSITIEEQKENIDDSEKKLKNLKEDADDMQKKVDDLKKDMSKNKEEQQNLESKIQEQKKVLDDYNSKLNMLKK